jgi:hypothetical protein
MKSAILTVCSSDDQVIRVLVADDQALVRGGFRVLVYLSPATAKTHVGRLLTKLQARDRTQLVVTPTRRGWSRRAAPEAIRTAGLERLTHG